MKDEHVAKEDTLEKESGVGKEVPVSVDQPTSVASSAPNAYSQHNTVRSDFRRPGKVKMRFLGAALLLIVSASAGFTGGWLGNRSGSTPAVQKQEVVLKNQGQLISSIADQVSPSVVSVEAAGVSQPSTSQLGGLLGFGGGPATQQVSEGTGIIIDKSGLIITNRHVVPAGTTSVSVTLSDGTQYDNVQVVGRTSTTDPLDIAFLKIGDTKGKTLTAATLGDSSKVGVGDSVIAIGNALGQYQNTVTSGIISGHGRNVQAGDSSGSSTESLQNLFQTDAAINEGNSGGPLVSLDGQVIGINTAVASDAQSIGFAIPINDIKGTISSVLTTGKLERPYLGVQYVPITADLAKQYNLSSSQGVYVPPAALLGTSGVIAGGPADKAGIKEGDIITKVDNGTIDENTSLTSLLDQHSVGDKVTLTIIRNGKQTTLSVTLGAEPQG